MCNIPFSYYIMFFTPYYFINQLRNVSNQICAFKTGVSVAIFENVSKILPILHKTQD